MDVDMETDAGILDYGYRWTWTCTEADRLRQEKEKAEGAVMHTVAVHENWRQVADVEE